MIYLSQLLGKNVYFENKPFGKLVDMAVFANRPTPPISKFEILRDKKKLTISPLAFTFQHNHFILKTKHVPLLPYDHKDFYLVEDLLDKQVIDVNGKRIVRVNDVLLEINGETKVGGIDVGISGILRRLGATHLPFASKIIPWQDIEAFDYQTGRVQIKLTQGKLNTLHPSEIAAILEDVGTKERIGIVAALDAKKAARAIEEADAQTQVAILEEMPLTKFRNVLNKMRSSRLVDILNNTHSDKMQEIQGMLGEEKAEKVKKLLNFSDNVAGGLMHVTFFSVDGTKTVREIRTILQIREKAPETIIVTNGNQRLLGVVYTKNLLIADPLTQMKDIISEKKFVQVQESISNIFKLFSEYNLRALPVVDKEKKPIGIIIIDDLVRMIEHNETV